MKNIVKFFVMTALALLLAISCASAASDNPNDLAPKPPVLGGYISGNFMEPRYDSETGVFTHYHEGLDIGIEEAYVYAPVDGTVWHGSGASSGFGEGWVYFVSDDSAYPVKLRMFVGDLDSWTAQQPSDVKVKKGDPIGYISGFTKPSTGPHPHFQFYAIDPGSPYAPYLNDQSGSGQILLSPEPILTSLGVDLTGAVDYSGNGPGPHGHDGGKNKYVSVAAMEYVGSLSNKIVKDWTEIATNSVVNITPYALSLLSLLCIIDLALPMLLGGFSSFNPNQLIVKAIRYAATFGLIIYWPEFINNILISFIESFGSAFSPDIESITSGVTQPQLLLQKAMFVITPAFQKISSYGYMEYLMYFGEILSVYIWTFALVFIYIFTAAYITLCWVEFYVSAALNVATVPFASWSMSRFIPEGMGGHLISSAIKLLIISILVGMVSLAIQDQKPMDIFKMPTTFTQSKNNYNITAKDLEDASKDNALLKSNLEKLSKSNPYIAMIIKEAQAGGMDPALLISIAAVETGGQDPNAIYMHKHEEASGSGLFQIDPNQSIVINGEQVKIDKVYLGCYDNPEQNTRAAIAMFWDKVNYYATKYGYPEGSIEGGIVAYNGGGDPHYLSKVQNVYAQLTGKPISTFGFAPMTTAMVANFAGVAIALIVCAFMILWIPKRIMRIMGGPLETPQQ